MTQFSVDDYRPSKWVEFMRAVQETATANGWSFDEKSRIWLGEKTTDGDVELSIRTGDRHVAVRGYDEHSLLSALARELSQSPDKSRHRGTGSEGEGSDGSV
jgi:hypothetical protein